MWRTRSGAGGRHPRSDLAVVYLDGVQVGAIDVTALGAPKLYLARDTPEAMTPVVVTAMLTAYLVSGVIPR